MRSIKKTASLFFRRSFFQKDDAGDATVIGFIMTFMLSATILVTLTVVLNDMVDDRHDLAASLEAKTLANSIASSILNSLETKETIPNATYREHMTLPAKIGDYNYYVFASGDYIYVNSSNGRISEKAPLYNIGAIGGSVDGFVANSFEYLRVRYAYSELRYHFDFGTPNSPLDAGAVRATGTTSNDHWWNGGDTWTQTTNTEFAGATYDPNYIDVETSPGDVTLWMYPREWEDSFDTTNNISASNNVVISDGNITLLWDTIITTYDFLDSVNNRAYEGDSFWSATETTEYNDLRFNDGIFQMYSESTRNDYAYTRFEFTINEELSSINRIDITWNGRGDGYRLYVYHETSGWVQVASNSGTSERTETIAITSDIASYIDNSGVLYFAARSYDDAGLITSVDIQTDFISAVVESEGYQSPGTVTSIEIDPGQFLSWNMFYAVDDIVGTWNYRMPVTITGTGTALTDYQLLLTLDTQSLIGAGKMNADGSDMRFTDASGIELDYWIESGINTASTQVWVSVPTIAASGDTTIYLVYGRPSASSSSDKDSTFLFWDDFSTDTGWTYVESDSDFAGAYQTDEYSSPSRSYEVESAQGATVDLGAYGEIYKDITLPDTDAILISSLNRGYNDGGSNPNVYMRLLADSTVLSSVSIPGGTSTVDWTERSGSYSPGSTTVRIHLQLYFGQSASNWADRHVWWDDILIRTYSAATPGASVGSEEAGSFGPLTNPGSTTDIEYRILDASDDSVLCTISASDAAKGYNLSAAIAGTPTVKIFAMLTTTDIITVAPTLTYWNISWLPIMPINGTIVSSPFDAGVVTTFDQLAFSAANIVGGTSAIQIQIRSAPSAAELALAQWYGPTNTSDYYTADGPLNAVHAGHRWVQYKVYLETYNEAVNPALEYLSVHFDCSWDYRVPVIVGSGDYARMNHLVETSVDFGTLWQSLYDPGTFDTNSIRVVEYDPGTETSVMVPSQCDVVSETFDDGDANGWTVSSGTWTVDNGAYRQTDTALTRTYSAAGDSSWTDYVFEGSVKFNSVNEEAQFLFRAQDDSNHYEIWLRGRSSDDAAFNQYIDGVMTTLGTASLGFSVEQGIWYSFKIEVSGTTFTYSINDRIIFQVSDMTFASGRIGLSTWQTDASFDDITVTTPDGIVQQIDDLTGTVSWVMDGVTSSYDERYYYIYLDSIENGYKQRPSYPTDVNTAVTDDTLLLENGEMAFTLDRSTMRTESFYIKDYNETHSVNYDGDSTHASLFWMNYNEGGWSSTGGTAAPLSDVTILSQGPIKTVVRYIQKQDGHDELRQGTMTLYSMASYLIIEDSVTLESKLYDAPVEWVHGLSIGAAATNGDVLWADNSNASVGYGMVFLDKDAGFSPETPALQNDAEIRFTFSADQTGSGTHSNTIAFVVHGFGGTLVTLSTFTTLANPVLVALHGPDCVDYTWENVSFAAPSLSSVDRAIGDAVQRDFVTGVSDQTFTITLQNGTYSVTVIIGDGTNTIANVTFGIEGRDMVHSVSTSAGEFYEDWFQFDITGNDLTFSIRNRVGGSWTINGLYIDLGLKEIVLEGIN